MVLGNRLGIVLLCFVTILNINCNSGAKNDVSGNSIKQTDNIINGKYEFKLLYNNKNNYLIYRNIDNGTEEKYNLTIKPPCYFGRKKNGEPEYYSYLRVKVQKVLIVIGSPEIDEISSNEKNTNYVQRVHGILIYEDNSMAIANKIMRRIAVNIYGGLDEKDFSSFAYDYNPRLKKVIQTGQ